LFRTHVCMAIEAAFPTTCSSLVTSPASSLLFLSGMESVSAAKELEFGIHVVDFSQKIKNGCTPTPRRCCPATDTRCEGAAVVLRRASAATLPAETRAAAAAAARRAPLRCSRFADH